MAPGPAPRMSFVDCRTDLPWRLRSRARADGCPKLLHGQKIGCKRLSIGALRGAVTALGIEKVNQAGRSALVSIFGDIPIGLRLGQISGAVKLHDLVVGSQVPVGIVNVAHDALSGGFLAFLR